MEPKTPVGDLDDMIYQDVEWTVSSRCTGAAWGSL